MWSNEETPMIHQRIQAHRFGYALLAVAVLVLTAGGARADADADQRATPMPDGQQAEIVMNVPLDALIFIDGQRTYNSGLTRLFVTPPLASGRRYYYDVKVTWVEGNRAREYTRHLSFHAGERVAVNLARPNQPPLQQDLYMDPAAPAPWRTDYYNDIRNAPNWPNRRYIYPGTRVYPR
jgi:uncharacterized protein (TIGR03000 family)